MYVLKEFVIGLVTLTIYGLMTAAAGPEKCFSDETAKSDAAATIDLYDGQLDFSLRLLRLANELSGDDNVFFSPHSIYQALLMSYFMSRNATLRNMKRMLNIDESVTKRQLLNAYLAEKIDEGDDATGVEFKSLNRIYFDEQLKIRDCMQQMFADELHALDFAGNSTESRLAINEWVANYTNGMIPELLADDAIDSTTKVALVNAAYFKGLWTNPFDKTATTTDVFYGHNSSTTFTYFMNLEKQFHYERAKDLQSTILEIPFKDSVTSMFIVLPLSTKQENFDAILKKLSGKKLYEIFELKNFFAADTKLSLPKFTVERELQFRNILEKLDFFKESSADFSDLTGENNVRFSDGVHKAKITVDEEGSEAAASSAVISFRSSEPRQQKTFKCNHPFVYFIYDSRARRVLFEGIFRKPDAFHKQQ